MTCRKCGAEVPVGEGPGRPAAYCSTGCRRAAEYELRRAQRALEGVEERARLYRFGQFGRPQEPPVEVEEERLRLEARLRELLDGSEEVA